MASTRIGVISDTHGLLRNQAREMLQGCQLIIHAGDIDSPSVLGELERIAPTTAVRGNMDWASWANHLRITERIQVDTWSIVVVHNIGDLPSLRDNTDIVIFGHSHKFLQEYRNGLLFLNPGSVGPRRFDIPISMAILTLGAQATVEQKLLESKR
ncbi:MAG TPA: hypothetical protein DDZ66_09800 [Firmicutes bacterium]|jgi:hypothetical protein|nr:hypothetical protein [Bacillota bacterium]